MLSDKAKLKQLNVSALFASPPKKVCEIDYGREFYRAASLVLSALTPAEDL